jgi:hypothetical protein
MGSCEWLQRGSDKTGAQMSDPSRKLVTGEAAGIALAIMKFAGLTQV